MGAAGDLAISGITVALEDAAIVAQVARRAIARSTFLEPVGDHRRSRAAERPVVARVGPQPGGLGFPGAWVQSRQRRFIGEDALAFADARKDVSGQRLEVEPDRAHPLRHQRPSQFDSIAGVDGFLSIERQTIGVFGDGDLRQQRLGRQTGFHNVLGRRRLQDLFRLLEGVFRSDRHDEPETRPHDIEPDALVLADLDPLLALEARRNLRFEDFLDPLQM
jgi:hypothetical protein